MKKFFKIFGISSAIIFGVVLLSIGVFALMGGFNEHIVGMTSIYFDTESEKEKKLIIEDDIELTINFAPLDATEKKLKTTVDGEECVDVPAVITAGEPFKIRVKKDANGRNIGGNVQIRFSSESKDSISNLITPCKLQITVDVPVEDSDLKFSSTLRYVSSVDRPNQYIVSKNNSKTTFYLYSNKNNIFDINQWSSTENKEIYFSYLVDGDSEYTNVDVVTEDDIVNNIYDPIDCFYNNVEDRYELNFYPGRIDSNILTVNTKVHRSYAIQQEFINSGFGEFEKVFLKKSVGDLLNDATFITLLDAYNDFLDKYYIKYFASGNAEAMRFFTNLSSNGYVNIPASDDIKNNITKSLQYVYVVNSIQFYVSDVKIKSFSVNSTTAKDMSLVTFDKNNNKSRQEVLSVSTDSKNLDKSLFYYFGINLSATNSDQSSTQIDDIALQNLMNSVTVDVLVYDGSGKSTMEDRVVSFPLNSNSKSNWSTFLSEINQTDREKIESGTATGIFGYNSQYLTVQGNEPNGDITNKTWVIDKLVPSKNVDNFQIYLMFTLKVNDEDGEKTFFDFAKVNINEDSDTSRKGNDLNTKMAVSDTMYVYTNDEVGNKLAEKDLVGNTQNISYSNVEVGSYKSTFDSFKLFVYLGTEATLEGGAKTIQYDDNSIVTESYFDSNVRYNVLSNLLTLPNGNQATRLCRFTDLDGKVLTYYTKDGALEPTTEFVTVDVKANQKVVYAYEIDWENLQALTASNNNVIVFGCYVLTDANNNPIDREGCYLFNATDGSMVDKDGSTYSESSGIGEFISVDGVMTPVVNYITITQNTGLAFQHKIKVKTVIERLYYYSQLGQDTTLLVKDTSKENSEYYVSQDFSQGDFILRNVDSSLLNSELRLIAGNSYDNILIVLPYDVNIRVDGLTIDNDKKADVIQEQQRLENNSKAIANHKLLTNQLLAYLDAVAHDTLSFATSETYATLTMDKSSATANEEVKTYDNVPIHPIYLSIKATKAFQGTTLPQIALAEDYKSNAIYEPENTFVSMNVYEARITGFKYLFAESGNAFGYDEQDPPVAQTINVTGSLRNTNQTFDWSDNIYHKVINQPVMFDTDNNGKIASNILTYPSSNIQSTLLTGVNISETGGTISISFNFGEGQYDPDLEVTKYLETSVKYVDSCIDISMLNATYIDNCLLQYLFDLSGYDPDGGKGYTDYINDTLLNSSSKITNIYNTNNIKYTSVNNSSYISGEMYVNVYSMNKIIVSGSDTTREPINPSEYYKYFNGYTQNNTPIYQYDDGTKYIQVKVTNISKDPNSTFYALDLNTQTEHFEFAFDVVWTFGGEVEQVPDANTPDSEIPDTQKIYTVRKTYNVDVTFEVPTFETTNYPQAGLTVDAGGNITLSDYIIAIYDIDNQDLKGQVKYRINTPSYAYFEDTNNNNNHVYEFVGDNAILHLYDSLTDNTLTVTASLTGCPDIVLTINITKNLVSTNSVKSSKIVSYSNFGNLYNSADPDAYNGTISYNKDTDSISYALSDDPGDSVSFNVSNFEVVDGSIKGLKYDLLDFISLKKNSSEMIAGFKLVGAQYLDLSGNKVTMTTITDNGTKLTFVSNSVWIVVEGTTITIYGELYTDIQLTLQVSGFASNLTIHEDSLIRSTTYNLHIYPMMRVTKADWTKLEGTNVFAKDNILFENNSSLYGSTFGLEIMTDFVAYDNEAPIPQYSSENLRLDENQIQFTKSDALVGLVWKEKEIKAQFYNYSTNAQGEIVYSAEYNNLGNVVFGSNNNVSIENGVLYTKPLPQSFVIPVTVQFVNAFFGVMGNSVTVLLPVAGYELSYKQTKDATSIKASFNYETMKFTSADDNTPITISLLAGTPNYSLLDYITIKYAGNDLELFSASAIATTPDTSYLNFVDMVFANNMGSLVSASLDISNFINNQDMLIENLQISGYTITTGTSKEAKYFGEYICFDIKVIPNVRIDLVDGGFTISNGIQSNNLSVTYGASLEDFVKEYILYTDSTKTFNIIPSEDGTTFKYQDSTDASRYILFQFDSVVLNGNCFIANSSESDDTVLSTTFLINISSGIDSTTLKSDLPINLVTNIN